LSVSISYHWQCAPSWRASQLWSFFPFTSWQSIRTQILISSRKKGCKHVARYRTFLLPSDSNWFYDHNKNPEYSFDPGSVISADCATFSAICDQGLSIALLNLGACSMLPRHMHVRAANAVVAMSDSTTTNMIHENDARMTT
jgi:hypothetical protein